MKDEEFLQILDRLYTTVVDKERICYVENCNNIAIDSHAFQKNRIHRTIAENKQIVRWVPSFFIGKSRFKITTPKEAFAFKGFCKEHDDRLFKPIESQDKIDFDYSTKMLLSYRALFFARKLKEYSIEWCQEILNAPILKGHIDRGFGYQMIHEGNLQTIDYEFYKNAFQFDIENIGNESFIHQLHKPVT